MTDTLFGIPVVVSDQLPIAPSDKENARRIVRHGLRDILEWLGEDVGMKPGEETHILFINDPWYGRSFSMSEPLFTQLKEQMPHGR